MLKVNQCITPIPVCKTKYFKMTTHKNQFINFINTYSMLRSLYKNSSLPAFLVRRLL